MKPYLLVSGDFRRGGGMDRANYALAAYLAQAGHETHLVANSVDKDLAERPNIIFHPVGKPFNSYMLGEPLLNRRGQQWAAVIRARGGRVIVNGGNCDWNDVNWVHYVHSVYRPSGARSVVRRLKNRLHAMTSIWRESRIIKRAKLVIANSERSKTDLIDLLGIPESNISRVYYGIDSVAFRPFSCDEKARARAELGWSRVGPVVLFVGELGDSRKGFDTVFRSWEKLCNAPGWDAILMVVGSGAMLSAWTKRIERSGMSTRVKFLGKRQDMSKLLAGSDAFVAPTRYEAYGLAVHEALCCGLPAFVTSAAGVSEQYPPSLKQLLIEDPNDCLELTERLRRWRMRPECYRAELSILSEKLRTHGWNEMASDIVSAIETEK
jgi:glycosyltransferase involved in cell wall biosynthesis